MTLRVGFLRAVNVGNRTVAMSRLAEIVGELGYDGPWTYLNSGNVVFDATGRRADVETSIERALEAEYGFEVTTFVRTPAELRAALALEPFPVDHDDTYFVTFLETAPTAAVATELESFSNNFDTLVVNGVEVHWRMRGRSTETTLRKKHWKVLGEHSTSRNVTMLRKLLVKLEA